MSHPALSLKVTRQDPELIAPAAPTPRELKYLSDIDDQEGLRFHIPVIQFYRQSHLGRGRDPVRVIREAIAKALVHYYPFAGRLREVGSGGKLAVDCTGEGVMFIEADANVSVDEFGDVLQPPFPGLDELLFDVPGSGGVVGCPLILIQVTRLICGGFIVAIRLNHTMADATGLVNFMTAVGEMARGQTYLSVQPVWRRELLNARNPPRVTCVHHEYDQVEGTIVPFENMVHRSFFFGPDEVAALRKLVPPHLTRCSAFELLTAALWRTRTVSLKLDPAEEVRVMCIVNARDKFNPPLPKGYYGNAFAFPVALTSAGELSAHPIEFALQLVKKAKNDVTEESMKSVADLMVLNNRPHFTVIRSYVVSDVTRTGFETVDFGWGEAAYGGPAKGGVGAIPGVASFYIPAKNKKGEKGITIPVCLPAEAMDVFVKEMDGLLETGRLAGETSKKMTTPFITSAL
uniref:Benzyl alcohol O-benzoyltransferase n=1 Tax=Kalanchoe fedtschenkoi TaxID=63787 RepID=A0A7N0ZTL2_KALFE